MPRKITTVTLLALCLLAVLATGMLSGCASAEPCPVCGKTPCEDPYRHFSTRQPGSGGSGPPLAV